MNLAICSVGEMYGGVERQILDLCQYWRSECGEAPTVVLFHDRELASRLRLQGITPVILQNIGRYDPRVLSELVEILRQRKIDVVHAHGYKATIGSALAGRKLRFGLVKTEHGMIEPKISEPIAWLKSRLNFAVEQFLTKRFVDTVCYVTADIGGLFVRYHGSLSRQTVHNGIEPLSIAEFRRPSDLPSDCVNIGIVGRVSAIKGIPIAIEAMGKLKTQSKVRLNIIGTGKLVDTLKEAVGGNSQTREICFLGFRRNIYDYLAHLDVLLMPSYHEGLPYTLLEAMSLGKPIIASNVGGLSEVLSDGYNGLLCPVGQARELAECMDRVLSDEKLSYELARNAQADQNEKYTLENMGNQYKQIYECVNQRRSVESMKNG